MTHDCVVSVFIIQNLANKNKLLKYASNLISASLYVTPHCAT